MFRKKLLQHLVAYKDHASGYWWGANMPCLYSKTEYFERVQRGITYEKARRLRQRKGPKKRFSIALSSPCRKYSQYTHIMSTDIQTHSVDVRQPEYGVDVSMYTDNKTVWKNSA